MVPLLIIDLCVVLGLLMFVAVGAVRGRITDRRAERAQIEFETRRAEWQLHRVARDGFAAMLEATRAEGRRRSG